MPKTIEWEEEKRSLCEFPAKGKIKVVKWTIGIKTKNKSKGTFSFTLKTKSKALFIYLKISKLKVKSAGRRKKKAKTNCKFLRYSENEKQKINTHKINHCNNYKTILF